MTKLKTPGRIELEKDIQEILDRNSDEFKKEVLRKFPELKLDIRMKNTFEIRKQTPEESLKKESMGITHSLMVINESEKMICKCKSYDPANEIRIMNIIDKYHKGLQKYIIKPIDNDECENAGYKKEPISTELIIGKSLEDIIKNYKIPKNKALEYSAQICEGLIEMRRARVFYHRDIRPANIMIDFERDRAIIIDLEIATTNKYALSKDNRRFGFTKGKVANDLVSLGQIMYYMATGKHLFNKSESMTKTFSDVAEEINDYRTKVYSDETGELLKTHLKQVDNDIRDDTLRKLTKACLTSEHYQYNKINKMFKEYLI
jgi:serine/threonine protein kinase